MQTSSFSKTTAARRSFPRLLISGLGYMVMGNVLSTVMTISLASAMGNSAIMGMSVLFAVSIYLLLVAVPAYKNGMEEKLLLKSKRVESVPMYRWLCVGGILFGITAIPSVVFLFGGLTEGVYRLLNGAVYPLSMFLTEGTGEFVEHFQTGETMEVTRIMPFAPYIFMGVYALTTLSCHIG
ncbi:MAG: hypothetical protein FWF82_02780, partial [Oscillospiraceae bacterium]|nr:hypothetical protein [Oscillospiraceae bacterium]